MEFLNWFKDEGYKKYGLYLLVGLVLTTAIIAADFQGMWSDGGVGATTIHTIMVLIGHLVVTGFDVGVVYHMIKNYKANA